MFRLRRRTDTLLADSLTMEENETEEIAIELSEDETAALEPSVIDTTAAAPFRQFDESKYRRKPKGTKGGGQFTVKENAAGRFEVVDDETGKKVAEATTETDAQVLADEKNAGDAVVTESMVNEQAEYQDLVDRARAVGVPTSLDDPASPVTVEELRSEIEERGNALRNELVERSGEMGDTEFSVKAQRLRHAGGFWPRGLSDWQTPEGIALRQEIARRRGRTASILSAADDEADAIVASIPVHPPAEWFARPDLDGPTPITITSDGRIYGHAALWGTCHLGNPRGAGVCVQPPRSQTDYGLFHLGELETAEGVRVPVGQITLDTGHAPLGASARSAAAHYDDTGSVVADVGAGEDEHGIYFAGALRPDASPEKVRKLLAAKISGDWRGGELVGMLAVNVPGFPVPRTKARLVADAGGTEEILALVAAGIVGERELDARELEIRVQVLAARAEGGIEGLADLAER